MDDLGMLLMKVVAEAKDALSAGDISGALASLENAKKLFCDNITVIRDIGLFYFENNFFDMAADVYASIVESSFVSAEDWYYLSLSLHALRAPEAKEVMRQATCLAPDWAEAWIQLSMMCEESDFNLSLAAMERAVLLLPDNAQLWYNFGTLLLAPPGARFQPTSAMIALLSEDVDAAPCDDLAFWASRALWRAALLDPAWASTWYNLGLSFLACEDSVRAAGAFIRAAHEKPDWADAWYNLGTTLVSLPRSSLTHVWAAARAIGVDAGPDSDFNAESALLRAQALGASAALWNLAALQVNQGRLGEAATVYTQLLASSISPDQRRYAVARRYFCLVHSADPDAAALDQAASDLAAQELPPRGTPPLVGAPRRSGPLRVGYLTGWWWMHQIRIVLEPLFAAHDPQKVAPILLDASPAGEAAPWRGATMPAQGDPATIAAAIAALDLDLLVALDGPLSEDLRLIGLRPARRILSWTGDYWHYGRDDFPDGVIVDALSWPANWRRPPFAPAYDLLGGFAAYDPAALPPPVDPTPPMLRRGQVTFGSFNRPSKYRAETAAAWARILARVPGSRLVLRYRQFSDPSAASATAALFHAAFAEAGVAPERLELMGEVDVAGWGAAFDEIDVMLDPFPFGGGIVAAESLAAGIAYPCRYGDRFMSRVAAAMVERIGATELIASDAAGVEDLAVALAQDPERLRRLRQSLPIAFRASPLVDSNRLAREMEDLYAQVCAV